MRNDARSYRPVSTTESSIRILEQLKETPGMSLGEFTQTLDLARSTIHRHLLTLEDNGLITREDGRYFLGLRFLDFGIQSRAQLPFYESGREHVDRLADETGEKAWLIARDGDFSVHLYKAYGENPLETYARVGQQQYLHQLAAGKAILAYLPDDELQAIIDRQGLEEVTENTITEEEELLEELAAIRNRGYAYNLGESIEGLNAVGAPIRNEDGMPVGSISISGPANRVKGDFLEEELPDKLLATIDEIQITLRYSSD